MEQRLFYTTREYFYWKAPFEGRKKLQWEPVLPEEQKTKVSNFHSLILVTLPFLNYFPMNEITEQ